MILITYYTLHRVKTLLITPYIYIYIYITKRRFSCISKKFLFIQLRSLIRKFQLYNQKISLVARKTRKRNSLLAQVKRLTCTNEKFLRKMIRISLLINHQHVHAGRSMREDGAQPVRSNELSIVRLISSN